MSENDKRRIGIVNAFKGQYGFLRDAVQRYDGKLVRLRELIGPP